MKKLKIGLAGLGIVGGSVYDILINHKNSIDKKSANKLELVAVSSRTKKEFIDESKVKIVKNAIDLANDPEIDIIVEVIGGDGVAKELIETAIKNGKKIVTANKALLAAHGYELTKLSENSGSYIAFEASIAGAVPIVKNFKESFSGNKINNFYGILNGTSNYILSKMTSEGGDFSDALKAAQELGYAESDPTFDIEGIDAAHKLALLSAIALGAKPKFADLYIEGITQVSAQDIKIADELGYKIKSLCVFKNLGESSFQAVYPALIDSREKIAQVDNSFNAILTNTSFGGDSFIVGRGAGGNQTASAIISDLIDIANDRYAFEFGVRSADLTDVSVLNITNRVGKYFIKLELVKDSELDKNFLDKIKAEKSYFFEKDESVVCGLVSGEIKEKDLLEILKDVDDSSVKKVKFIRVEETGLV